MRHRLLLLRWLKSAVSVRASKKGEEDARLAGIGCTQVGRPGTRSPEEGQEGHGGAAGPC